MIIHEVQLTNIGPYRGTNNHFDFETNSEQNKTIILIGGENGAGKTTLLNAIKLGLFGSYGFGYKTENSEYFNKVKKMLNREAIKENENNFRIRLNFTLVDNFEKTNYMLYRYWRFTNDTLKEHFDLVANGKHFSDYEKEVFQSKLKEIMPPQLLELCLFDGEEISRIVNEDLLPKYLKKVSSIVFNLDLFEALEQDLSNYIGKKVNKKRNDSLEKEYYLLEKQKNELKHVIWDNKAKLKKLMEEKSEIENEYFHLKKQFEKHGGLVKSQRDEISRKINEIELLRKKNMENIKDFVSNLLPFFLTKRLVKETREQIKEEEAIQLYKQLHSKLTEDKIKIILQSMNMPDDSDRSSKLRDEILNLLKPSDDIIQIHEASLSESSLIENIFLQVSGYRDKEILQMILENKEKLNELQKLKETLKINDSTTEFKDMILRMQDFQQKIYQLNQEIETLNKELEKTEKEYTTISNAFEKKRTELLNEKKSTNSVLQAQKIIEFSKHFRALQMQKKLQDIQIEATKLFKKILRKQNYITKIVIDPNSFEIKLFDFQNEYIDRRTLSAGEKEILLISIIWAVFKCSRRNVPFIFDTLLGRLDRTHKTAILKEFIPFCSNQVIILSTDSEIDESNYKILEPFISKAYMLDFNVNNKKTKIETHYFPIEKWS